MASPRDRRHILVPRPPSIEKYRPHGRAIRPKKLPGPPSRPRHGGALKHSFEQAVTEAAERRQTVERAGIRVHGATPGLYIEFESQPDTPLKLSSFENVRAGIELVAVTEAETPGPDPKRIERATVFVPDGKVGHFISRFEKYANPQPKRKGERRHEDMLDPVATLRLATLRGLWTDDARAYPQDDQQIWWEVWLRRHDGGELSRLMEFASIQGLEVSERRLEFDTRVVVLVEATPSQLAASLHVLNDLAEVQRAKETAALFADMGPEEQADWTTELLDRVTPPHRASPAVCVLDTGISRGHPLLDPFVLEEDCHAVDPSWGNHDDGGGPAKMGHGTQMAGLALFGDLTPMLSGSAPLELRHGLESVKILPPKGSNPPDVYGAITALAVSRVEIPSPTRSRAFAMAVTATDERDRGQPTSWSTAIDALAIGRVFDSTSQGLVYLDTDDEPAPRRLFVVSAGNIGSLSVTHLDQSDADPIHDPGQAWNVLTVGAFTHMTAIHDPAWAGWQPLAASGDLSPWSTTSVTFAKQWPLKPDVVFEGGNVVHNASGSIDFPCEDLCLLSTYFRPAVRLFTLCYATSAATAQAARMAATIQAQYPQLWPESVRGLIVHSAEWTPAMRTHLRGANGKRQREMLVRRYGFGVPQLGRALNSARDSLTLIAQGTAHPFLPSTSDPNRRTLGHIHFFELPWPKDALLGLGEQSARLRVTLSYFVEPNPGRRGWKKRHQYASHGLRFEVKRATESLDEFRKRLNQRALDEEEDRPVQDEGDDWYLGPQARNRGSIHSDMLPGFAADLAERGVIAVYPVTGWWKEQPRRDRSDRGVHYSLIVSIETDATDVDIWTPVAVEVGLQTEIVTDV